MSSNTYYIIAAVVPPLQTKALHTVHVTFLMVEFVVENIADILLTLHHLPGINSSSSKTVGCTLQFAV